MDRLIKDAFELYTLLQKQDLMQSKPPMWWPNYGSFEVLIGAILTQNAQWKRVEVSLENLRSQKLLNLESLSQIDIDILRELIAPSGLFKSKAEYISRLSRSIKESFGDFEHFCLEVDRTWLLGQKGIGPESADSILCYACRRDAMVVDAYTTRLVKACGHTFTSYDQLQSWCTQGLKAHFQKEKLNEVYALFHGIIVEFVKANSKGKTVNIESLK